MISRIQAAARVLALLTLVWALALMPLSARATETLKILAQASPSLSTGTVTITNASPGVVTFTGSNAAVGDMVVITTSGSLPTGLTAGTTYFVISAGLTANAFELSATAGGSAINTSSAGSGTHTAKLYRVFYTVPASTSTVVSSITIANDSTTTNDPFTISVHPACAAWARKYQIAPSVAAPFNDTIIMTLGITLATTDCITIYSGLGTSNFNAFGSEVQ